MKSKDIKKFGSTLVTGEIYHIFSKSIAGFRIFKRKAEFKRIKEMLQYYVFEKPSIRFSYFLRAPQKEKEKFVEAVSKNNIQNKGKIVNIVAYCIMPTHIHLVLQPLKERGISIFMKNLLDSYTRYFNVKYKRKGPLWEGRFKRVWVGSENQLLHLTRYIHLNPVTAGLVKRPEEWFASSFNEYIEGDRKDKLCRYDALLKISPESYKKFVKERIFYQKQLAKIKELTFDV